jgi:hypothetical protein
MCMRGGVVSELPAVEVGRAGIEPATSRGDTGALPITVLLRPAAEEGTSRSCRCDSVPESNRRTPDNRAAPARDDRAKREGRPTRGRTRTREVGARDAASYTTGLYKEPPAGVEPAPRPYKGRVLAVDTTEARWRRWESNPRLLRCKRSGLPQASPGDANEGGRPESNRHCGLHRPGCLPLHHGHHELTGTTGLEPAACRSTTDCSSLLSYVPLE